MCGRYRIKDIETYRAYVKTFYGIDIMDMVPRFNVAPSQSMPVITTDDDGNVVATMRWGFVPFWEQSDKPKLAPINAQAEKAVTTGMFRQSVQKRRCLVPADGFYEWLRLDDGKVKFPFDIHLKANRPFVMAGIYEKATGSRPATFAILTTGPNAVMSRIHDRMPAILDEEEAKRWLTPGPIAVEEVAQLTVPHPAEDMEAVPISSLVNSPRNDLPEILQPVAFTPPPPAPAKQTQGELF